MAVDFQEAAVILAWIKEFPNEARRVLISLDGKEIYLTFPTYPQGWLTYIKTSRTTAHGA
ncbi:hypothetical protein BJX61DRAFT_540698 [Aspergillus egyptiacus]|nr:hypothetical protein BJX61DRAFT_540698 [Aspergillus egyptiacus]